MNGMNVISMPSSFRRSASMSNVLWNFLNLRVALPVLAVHIGIVVYLIIRIRD